MVILRTEVGGFDASLIVAKIVSKPTSETKCLIETDTEIQAIMIWENKTSTGEREEGKRETETETEKSTACSFPFSRLTRMLISINFKQKLPVAFSSFFR